MAAARCRRGLLPLLTLRWFALTRRDWGRQTLCVCDCGGRTLEGWWDRWVQRVVVVVLVKMSRQWR